MFIKHRLLLAPTPEVTGQPAAGSGSGDGVDAMVAEMNAAASSTPEPAATARAATPPPAPAAVKPPTPAPAAKPEPKAAAKSAAVTPTAKVEPKAADAPANLDWKSAPQQFRAAHEKLLAEHTQTKAGLESKLQETIRKMGDLEKRKLLTPEQEAKYHGLETNFQKLQAELYSRDFRESPEFKEKYAKRAEKVFANIKSEIQSIQIGEEGSQRPATMADFAKIQALGNSQVEQRRAAKAMFGDDADVVIAAARELKSIEDAANEEIDAKRNGFQTEREKSQAALSQEVEVGTKAYETYDRLLTEKFPQYFAPIEGNDEYNKALEEGLKYVDSNSAEFSQKTPEQRAQSAAMMRRWAAAFPALRLKSKQDAAKISELEATIAKLTGGDPGNGGDGGGGGGGAESTGGTDAMTEEIERLQREN